MGTNYSGNYAVNQPQKYYTTPTSSVQDKYGNVTNYYRGGDTTNTQIIDSYNKTFNTIWNTTNNSTTNNYSANVKLENFLNQYRQDLPCEAKYCSVLSERHCRGQLLIYRHGSS